MEGHDHHMDMHQAPSTIAPPTVLDHVRHDMAGGNHHMDNMHHAMAAAPTMGHVGHDMSDMHQMRDMPHGGHGAAHSMMSMTFHGGCSETILFSGWVTTEMAGFIGSFIAIFIASLLYEGLKYYRKHLLWKTYAGLQYCAVASPDKAVANVCVADEPQIIQQGGAVLQTKRPTMLSREHGWQTVLHAVQVFVSYLLMLVFMTYNTWLCLAVVLGSSTGYFLFGWRESVIVDFTEHCH